MTFPLNRLHVLVIAGLMGASAVSLAHAQEKKAANRGKAVSSEKSESAAAVESIRVADLLARYGYANKDPLALITAAKIKKQAGASESKAVRVGGKSGEAKSKPDELAADAVLARGRELAAGRADLVALADDIGKSGTRGAENGPGAKRTVVNTRAVDSYRVTFRGGEPARVVVSGDGDSDLDLYVYDENGNRICQDTDATDTMICSWTPRYTGPFTIRVRNLGEANVYRIVHN